MGNCLTDYVFRRQKFCCCLPARLGAALLSGLTMILAGVLTVVLWFEVRTNYFMSGREKAAFIVAGVVETFLLVASVLGFIGTCARKQSFVTTYSLFLYFHLLLNIGIAAYFLYEVTSTADKDIVKLCQEGLRNDQSEKQCSDLLDIAKGVYWAGALIGLSVESYCAIVVTRYVNQLRYEKRDVRRSRMLARQSAYDKFHARFGSAGDADFGFERAAEESGHQMSTRESRYSAVSTCEDMDKEGLLVQPMVKERAFDPYHAYAAQSPNSHGAISPGIEGDRRPSFASDATLVPGAATEDAGGAKALEESSLSNQAYTSTIPSPLLPPGAAPAALRPSARSSLSSL